MNHDTAPTPDRDTPKLELKEGVDFINEQELHERIMRELKALGIKPSEVLLCGYAAPLDDTSLGSHRSSTFGMTVEETQLAVDDGQFASPYKRAEDAFGEDMRAIVAAYNQDCFTPQEADHYELKEGLTIEDATFLTVELTEQ